jgi:hypothetical protein
VRAIDSSEWWGAYLGAFAIEHLNDELNKRRMTEACPAGQLAADN